MKTHRSNASSYKRLVRGIWLQIALIAMVALAFEALPQMFSAHAGARPNVPQGFLFTVNTTDDHNDFSCDGDDCTLREAIDAANNIPTEDTILFDVTGTINLTSVLPNIDDDVAIIGRGANLLTVQRTNQQVTGAFGIFNVTTTGTVTFSGMTISNGIASSNVISGGGILNSSTGTVNVTNCTISDNHVASGGVGGGGISNNGGTINVTNSTISDNTAFDGAGILNAGTLNVTNSTISDNTAFLGGGIGNVGTVNVTNSTITRNRAAGSIGGAGGGGIDNRGNAVTVKSSIIALNSAAGSGQDVFGAFTSQGFNLIGKTDDSTGFTAPTDLTGTSGSPLNPNLDPNGLQDNGGPTLTIALLPGSPAIDKATAIGLNGPLTTDQRGTGFPRTFDDPAIAPATGGDNTDIGAFELQPAAPSIMAGFSSLINESCPPANADIDPGERVTVNLELINTSSAATSNLVATLQTSGGVLAPSGPRSYGAIAVNSSATRDFSFTAEGTLISGQTITATLQLQDGAANLGAVSFNFTTGPTPCSFVRLVVTSSLSRADASTVAGAITVQNIGSIAANDVTLTTAKLGATNGTPLPQGLGNLAPGELASVIVNFNNSTPGSSSMLTAGGTYAGGTFSSSKRVTIP